MTRDFENMLYLFGCSATGKEINTEHCESLSKIRELSLLQESWDVVYAGLREKIISGEVKIPPEISSQLEKTFTANVALNIQKTEFNLNTAKELEKRGVKCCILKGVGVARFYKIPEARISSDTDILIDKKDEKKVIAILTELGYETEFRAKKDHHLKARHKKGGLLEVHVALHSVPTSDIILDDIVRYNEEFVKTEDGYYIQGINDGAIYLSAHLIKHFINDGAGVRQMMDLLLYIKHYEKEIDWEKYNALMKKLNYDTFISVIKGIGVKYFGMEFDDAITSGSGFEELLEDCEKSGLFGLGEKDRKMFYSYYTQKRAKKGSFQHYVYNAYNSERGLIQLFFPKLSTMKERYGYVEKYPFLLPFGWVHRLFDLTFLRKKNSSKSENKETREMIERRMNTVLKLGMIKE